MWMRLLSIPFQRCIRWTLVIDKYFHLKVYNGFNYLYMLGLKWNHVSERGPERNAKLESKCKIFRPRRIFDNLVCEMNYGTYVCGVVNLPCIVSMYLCRKTNCPPFYTHHSQVNFYPIWQKCFVQINLYQHCLRQWLSGGRGQAINGTNDNLIRRRIYALPGFNRFVCHFTWNITMTS